MIDFEDIHEKFYEKAEERKDKLIKIMLSKVQEQEVVTKLFSNIKNLDCFLDVIKAKTTLMKDNQAISCLTMDANKYCVDFKNGKDSRYHADYLCFHLFDLYRIKENNVIRYVYFELYFDDYILGVLMKKSAFNSSDKAFSPYDLDRREWAQAKLQMRMWKQIYRVETSEINVISQKEQSILDYLEVCKDTKPIEDALRNACLDALFSSDWVWAFVSYLTMVQMLPIIPTIEHPCFTLNLFQKSSITEGFADSMRKYNSILHLSESELPQEKVLILNSFDAKNEIQSEFERDVILVPYVKEKNVEYCCNILNEFAYEQIQDKKVNFPLQNVPIFIGSSWIINSAVLNLEIDAGKYMDSLIQGNMLHELKWILNSGIAKVLISNHDCTEELVEVYKDKTKEALEKAKTKWADWKDSQNFCFLQPEYFNLAAWLGLLLCGGNKKKFFKDENDLNPIYYLKKKLKKMENELQSRWNAYEAFIGAMLESKENLSRDKPKDKNQFEELSAPFLMSREDVGEIIVYSPQLFRSVIQEKYSNSNADQFIEMSYQKGLLKTNAPSKDGKTIDKNLNIKFGNDTCRCYAFIVSQLK